MERTRVDKLKKYIILLKIRDLAKFFIVLQDTGAKVHVHIIIMLNQMWKDRNFVCEQISPWMNVFKYLKLIFQMDTYAALGW